MIKKICLITPSHISSNPRLTKEAQSLSAYGYKVHIIFAQTLTYLNLEDEKILDNIKGVTYEIINNENLLYKIVRKVFLILSNLSNVLFFYNFLFNETYYSFLKAAARVNADLYIAHNLAALPIAVNAAKKNKAKCGFDAEDFHRNEVSNNPNDYDVKLKIFIEDKYLPKIDYLTASSRLIAQTYKKLYPYLNPIVICNVFEIKNQPKLNINKNGGLKLFWFSQTIGKNRGLEDVIKAINIINNPLVELHLLGNLSINLENYFNELAHFRIKYYKPISSDEIFELAAKFDVGLALEPGFCLNNEIALSNKLFAYLISGVAVIASDTQAQQQFMAENISIGKLYSIENSNQLAKLITELMNNKDLLNEYKRNAYQLAQSKYNWEKEQEKFLSTINDQIKF